MSEFKIDIGIVRGETYFNVHGDTAEEIDQTIASALPIYKKFKEAVEKAYATQAKVAAESNGLKAKCEDCGAEMVYKTGFGKKGKWEGLFCPNADRNDKTTHKPVWLS